MSHNHRDRCGQPVGAFELLTPIGSGGMGTAWKARHSSTDTVVALKTIAKDRHDELRAMFIREAKALARLDHPGVIQLLDFGQIHTPDQAFDPGTLYLVMEYADGGDLSCANVTAWPELVSLLVQILDALAHAHSRHRIHLDLKPGNILRSSADAPWHYQLADFGIARITTEFDAPTQTSGTPLYVPPEQVRGHWRSLGPWSDLYSLGCVAWEVATGSPPFVGPNSVAVVIERLTEPLPDFCPRFPVPPRFVDWLRRSMARKPAHRFRCAADAAASLIQISRTWSEADEDATHRPSSKSKSAPNHRASSPNLKGQNASNTTLRLDLLTTEVSELSVTLPWDATPPDSSSGDEPPPPIELPRLPFPQRPQHRPTDIRYRGLSDVGLGLFDLRPPPFVGRQKTLEQVWRVAGDVIQYQRPLAITLEGPTGVGKTRFVERLTTHLTELGQIQSLHFDFEERHWSDGLRTGLIRFFNGVGSDPDILRDQLILRAPGISSAEIDFLEQFLLDKNTAEFEAFSDLHQGLSAVLKTLSAARPLVIVADGVILDPFILELQEQLEKSCRDSPILTVISVPTERCSPLISARLKALPSTRRFTLTPLTDREVRQSLAGIFPLHPDELERLTNFIDGDLDYGRQILAHWIDGDLMDTDDNGYRGPDELPESPHHLWLTRLDNRLGASQAKLARRALGLAAVLGISVEKSRWVQICDRLQIAVDLQWIEHASRKGFIRDEGPHFVFSEPSFRHALLKTLRDCGDHRQVLAAVAKNLRNEGDRTHLFRAVRCLEQAGDYRAAFKTLYTASRLTSLRDTETVGVWLESLIDEGDDVPMGDRVHAVTNQALDHIQNCEFAAADPYLERARRLVERSHDPRAKRLYHHGLATRALFANKPEQGIALMRDVLDGAAQLNTLESTRYHSTLADLLLYDRQFEGAYRHLDRADALAIDQPLRSNWVAYQRANLEIFSGHNDEAERRLKEQIPVFQDHDDPFGVLLCRELLGLIAAQEQAFESAQDLLKQALAQAERVHYKGAITIREKLGRLYARWGRIEPAIEHLDAVRQTAQRGGFNILVWYYFDALAEAHCQVRDWDRVHTVFSRSLESTARPGLHADLIVHTWRRVMDRLPRTYSALRQGIDHEIDAIAADPGIAPAVRRNGPTR